MSHPSISEAFITCIFSLKVNLGQLGIHEWNTVALEGFHIHQCPGLFGMCSSFVLFLHSSGSSRQNINHTVFFLIISSCTEILRVMATKPWYSYILLPTCLP